MSDLQVTCTKCNTALEHVCNESVKRAVRAIFKYKPGFFPDGLKNQLDACDVAIIDDCEFFTETYLYALMGKEEARTVLALVNNLIRAAGVDPYELQKEVYIEAAEAKNQEMERLKRVAEGRAQRHREMLEPFATTALDVGWQRLEYTIARAWDDRIARCEKDKHDVTSVVLSKEGPAFAADARMAGTCTTCKLQYVLTGEMFKEWFVKPERTPRSKAVAKLFFSL